VGHERQVDIGLATPSGAVIGLYNMIESTLERHGLTMWQLHVLAFCALHPAATPGDLAAWRVVKKQTVTRHLHSLVERGLISRREDPDDRRRLTHAVTDAGSTLLKKVGSEMDGTIGTILEGLPPERAASARQGLLDAGEALDLLWFGRDRGPVGTS
jgi:DNA-binding MarR family transcriptional regulator